MTKRTGGRERESQRGDHDDQDGNRIPPTDDNVAPNPDDDSENTDAGESECTADIVRKLKENEKERQKAVDGHGTADIVRKLKKVRNGVGSEENTGGETGQNEGSSRNQTSQEDTATTRRGAPDHARNERKDYYESGGEDVHEDSVYRQHSEEEEDEELDAEEVDDEPESLQRHPVQAVTRRARKKKVIDYSSMELNDDGKVEISRRAFKPEGRVTGAMVMRSLGNRGRQMTVEQFKKAFDFFEQVKLHAAHFTRERIKKEIIKNGGPECEWNTVKDMQKAWANASEGSLVSMAKSFDRMLLGGYFASPDWPTILENETMDHLKVEYLAEDAEAQMRIGCFNAQATRSMVDMRKFIYELGRRSHGMILTRRRKNYKDGEKKQKPKSKKKGMEFQKDFLRKSESMVDKRIRRHNRTMDVYKVSVFPER